MSVTRRLYESGEIEPPDFLVDNLGYETRAGSHAYGVARPDSDIDISGFAIPPKEVVFPHLRGEIPDFGRQKQRFQQFQAHGVHFDDEEYDVTIYSIVRFFHLSMENNPNMIELLFTPDDCVTHATSISGRVRAARRTFLHKGAYHRFRGFAHAQLSKMRKKDRQPQRLYKYGYHAVRLLDEIEQILATRDLELGRDVEALEEIRAGEWTLDEIEEHCAQREEKLEELYDKSQALPHSPDEGELARLLLTCLEEHYGSLEGCIVVPDSDA
jgi:predicted nucleotidyltransferase